MMMLFLFFFFSLLLLLLLIISIKTQEGLSRRLSKMIIIVFYSKSLID